MLRILLKKQLLEINSFYFFDKRNGTRRSKGKVAGMVILFGFVIISALSMFFGMAQAIGGAIIKQSADNPKTWLFFSIMSVMAIMVGIFGSAFTTYSALYEAKDNEFLLSMPIKPVYILISRMTGTILMCIAFNAIVWVPSVITYWLLFKGGAVVLVTQLLSFVFITLFITVLVCILGFLIAMVSSRVKNKNAIRTFSSILFLVLYYVVYFRINRILNTFIEHIDPIADFFENKARVIYILGNACNGNIVYLLIIAAVSIILFALCCYVMGRSFIKLITSKTAVKQKEYKDSMVKTNSVAMTLYKKEIKAFFNCPIAIVNNLFGVILLLGAGVFAFIKPDFYLAMRDKSAEVMPFIGGAFPGVIFGAVALMSATNALSSALISLEGKTMWILRILPVDAWEVLKAKIRMHMTLSAVPAVFCVVALGITYKMDAISIIISVIGSLIFVWFTAVFGLALNIKWYNLDWSDPSIPVKSGPSMMLSFFGGFIIAFVLFFLFIGMYLFLGGLVPHIGVLMAIEVLLITIPTLFINNWIKKKGTLRFNRIEQ